MTYLYLNEDSNHLDMEILYKIVGFMRLELACIKILLIRISLFL